MYISFLRRKTIFSAALPPYDYLSADQIGAGYNTLRNVRWKETSVYVTPKAIIKIGKLLRAGSCKKQPIK